MSAPPLPSSDSPYRITRWPDAASAAEGSLGDLSDFFNPFIPHFITAALRSGGEVWASWAGSDIDGLLLYNEVERVGSVFTRHPAVAQALFETRDPVALFSDFPLTTRTETYHIFRTERSLPVDGHQFAHRVRLARPRDRPRIVQLMQEMYGRIDANWLPVLPSSEEKCLLVEVGNQVVGVGWVAVVNGHGRLHSLSVRPHYRRMGIGTDLWYARVLWAYRAGARDVLSEIADQNVASQAIATSAGMQKVGRLFLSYRPATATSPGSH